MLDGWVKDLKRPLTHPVPDTPRLFNRFTRWCRRGGVMRRWSIALGMVTTAFAVRSIMPVEVTQLAFVLFMPAVAVAGLLGRGPGVFAALSSAVLALYFFVEPPLSFTAMDLTSGLAAMTFVGASLATALLVNATVVAREQAEADRERAKQSEAEKDLLLEDFSHRIKNDMQRLAAMLHMQSRTANTPEARAALVAAAKLPTVLAKVHDRLSRQDGDLMVDASSVLEGLADDVRSGLLGGTIGLFVNAESYHLPVHRAGALGLVTNELITNALKHAFPHDREGMIRIRFHREEDSFILHVEDDGVGLSHHGSKDGTGRRIIRALTAQLGGRLEVLDRQDGDGMRASLTFPIVSPRG